MQAENIFILHPSNSEQINALKTLVKALKIKFETADESPYSLAIVSKIKKSKQEFREGKNTRVKKEDLSHFLGL